MPRVRLEKNALKEVLALLKQEPVDVPMYIGGLEVRTNKKETMNPPHEIKHVLGHYHIGEEKHVKQAIEAALAARESWAAMSWESRAHIFLKAADLIAYQIPSIYERYYHAGAKQERLPGRDRQRLRAHRLLTFQCTFPE